MLFLQQRMNSWMCKVSLWQISRLWCVSLWLWHSWHIVKLSQYIWHIDMINMTQLLSSRTGSVPITSPQICTATNSMPFMPLSLYRKYFSKSIEHSPVSVKTVIEWWLILFFILDLPSLVLSNSHYQRLTQRASNDRESSKPVLHTQVQHLCFIFCGD